jgi:signal transduction histidine kinase
MNQIDLNEVLKAVCEDYELLIEEKNARVSADLLPVISGIPVQINQLFGNLISNALKFTNKDRMPAITITSSVASPDEIATLPELKHDFLYHKITFRDNGIGFNQKNVKQIFDIFQRLHSKPEYQGTGIGLAMCKKITQNHNGDIAAESVEEQGAAFHVFLPKARYFKTI